MMKYFYIAETTCSGDITTCCGDYAIAKYIVIIQRVLNIIHFVVPIVLILMATIGIIKLMLSPDDPQKKSWKSLVNKFIAAIIVFFIPLFASALFKFAPNSFEISGCFQNAQETASIIDDTDEYTANVNQKCGWTCQAQKIGEEFAEDLIELSEYHQLIADAIAQYEQENGTTEGIDRKYVEDYIEEHKDDEGGSARQIVESNGTSSTRKSKSTSTSNSKKSSSKDGKDVVKYAKSFVGNPYVYGGTSLTNGADCSGFVMSVYKHFGIDLPRTAAAQAASSKGKTIKSISDAQPGDLLFYKDKSGNIGHVTIYEGNGKVVHASSSTTGIIESNVNYRTYTLIKRFL